MKDRGGIFSGRHSDEINVIEIPPSLRSVRDDKRGDEFSRGRDFYDSRRRATTRVAPFSRDSGKWQGKRFVQGGRPTVRSALYMAALSGSRSNPVLRRFYQSLVDRDKPRKVALTACMRKLLVILNAMTRDMRAWKSP